MKSLALLLSLGVLAVGPACSSSKDDPSPSSPTPKEYNVEYRLTSSSFASVDYISYYNETGGLTIPGVTPLPVTYKFKRTLKSGEFVGIDATGEGGTATSEITAVILLDGKQVKTTTARGEEPILNSVYVLP